MYYAVKKGRETGIFESWEEVGDGRDMMQKQGMTKVVQKCSVYIGLMGFKGIL